MTWRRRIQVPYVSVMSQDWLCLGLDIHYDFETIKSSVYVFNTILLIFFNHLNCRYHAIYLFPIFIIVSDGDQKKPLTSKGKAPKKMLNTELKVVAEGDEDMVEDLELSDQD